MGRKKKGAMPGDRYGRLTVLREVESQGGCRYVMCECACGGRKKVRVGHLKNGNVRSCGCIKWKHGDTDKTPEYRIWTAMKNRCLNPKHKQYKDYGGRGICVCERWQESYSRFIQDVGYRPSAYHTLDRINNDEGYEPGNVRWVTSDIQGRNRRTNHMLRVRGTERSLTEWAERANISVTTLKSRLDRGWSPLKALTTPTTQQGMYTKWAIGDYAKPSKTLVEMEGRVQTIKEWAREKGLSLKLVLSRLSKGWDFERALCAPVRAYKKQNS